MEDQYSEYKMYFENDEVYAVIGREKEPEENVDFQSLKAEKTEIKKVIPDMAVFKKYMAELPARIKAAKIEK